MLINFICEPCKNTADMLTAWREDGRLTKREIAAGKRGHRACPGGTQCMCQHRVQA